MAFATYLVFLFLSRLLLLNSSESKCQKSFSFIHNNSGNNEQLKEHFQRRYHEKECEVSKLYYNTSLTAVPPVKLPEECSVIQLPVKSDRDSEDELFDLLTGEFTVEWSVSEDCVECFNAGGQCLADNQNEFYCKQYIKKGNMTFRNKYFVGGLITAALASISIILILFIKRKYALLRLFGFEKAKSRNEKDIELFLKNNGNLAPKRYKYSDIKKMTKLFRKNLGKGGYGSVYEGKLPDGLPVAVKILDESKGNGEEFMNKVASISKTSHVNIVSLGGFCFEGCKRALIYEFMPNGSLEKFISNTASQGGLGWQKLFEIALGIARGLEYLHQGCKTRILHFDIKPHNILLDKDFNPRISDFGLARLCPNRSSIVSMMVARGTIGYIAPEVFCRNFGEVSHKSDVYSYGMMVLEMAGGKKNIDRADVDRSSEIYFPAYIYKQLEMNGNKGDTPSEIKNEDESQFAKRRLMIVGLWCIQTDPKDRPSMTKVVEMLEGKVESLHVPPKPNLSSPPRSVPKYSSSESI
ncbi:hypothetical protein ACS0TY_033345 [Phlomoides rotata]